MIEWTLEIGKVDNGYLCEGYSTGEDDYKELDSVWVVEDKDDEHETMVDLLRDVQSYFEVHYSKHNEKNCRVILADKDYNEIE